MSLLKKSRLKLNTPGLENDPPKPIMFAMKKDSPSSFSNTKHHFSVVFAQFSGGQLTNTWLVSSIAGGFLGRANSEKQFRGLKLV